MTMNITMRQTRMGEDGALLVSGSKYVVSDAFGAAMVGAGYAADSDDALAPTRSQASNAQVQWATRDSRQMTLAKSHLNLLSTNNPGSDYTMGVQTTIEGLADTCRIGILNCHTGTVAGVKCAVSTQTAAGAANAALYSGTHVYATFGGAVSATLPAALSTEEPTVTWTDEMWLYQAGARSDGGTLPIIIVRVEYPSGTTLSRSDGVTGWETEGSASVAPYGRFFRAREQAVLAASSGNVALLTSTTSASNWPAIIIEYTLRDGTGRTFVIVGDSISAGAGATLLKSGWAQIAQRDSSTLKSPIEVMSISKSGTLMATWIKRLRWLGPEAPKGSYCIIPNGSPNDTDVNFTTASRSQIRNYYGQLRRLAEVASLKVLGWTMIPSTASLGGKAWTTNDTRRIEMNADTAAGRVPTLDFSGAISAAEPVGDGSVPMVTGLTTDGTHPNDAGNVVLGNLLSGYIRDNLP